MDEPKNLSDAEKCLMAAAGKGIFADYSKYHAAPLNSACGAEWKEDSIIRAEVIRVLCLGVWTHTKIDPTGIQIIGARISGQLDLSWVKLAIPLIFHNCYFDEQIKLVGAEIKDLDLKNSYLAKGLSSVNLKVHGDVSLLEDFVAKAEVCLIRADIDGRLTCSGGKFEKGPKDKYAINAGGIKVKGSVYLRNGFAAKGEVRLPGAEIGGQLDCTGGNFKNPGGCAINASNLKIKGAVFFNTGFSAQGEVCLYWADIGDRLMCTGGSFNNPKGDALAADGIKVRGGVFLKAEIDKDKVVRPFTAKGEVRFNGADIGGRLNCTGGNFEAPVKAEGRAFSASGLKVKADVFFRTDPKSKAPFLSKGEVRLPGAEIGGHLDCTGGKFENPGGIALRIENTKVTAKLILFEATFCGELNLMDANVGKLCDDEKCWPKKGQLLLDGFKYGVLDSTSPHDTKKRKVWLALQKDYEDRFHPHPHEQLFQVLRGMGHELDARRIATEKQTEIRKDGGWQKRVWSLFLRKAVGYGYQTARVFNWVVGFFLVGVVIFSLAYLAGYMRPSDEDVLLHHCYSVTNQCNEAGWIDIEAKNGSRIRVPEDYPEFNPIVYSIDVLLPIVDLHQENYWLPTTSQTPWRWSSIMSWPIGKWFVRFYLWVHIFFGWMLTTTAVAAFTGVFKK